MHPFLKLVFFVVLTTLMGLAGLAYGGESCESATHCVLLELTPWHEDRDEPPAERSARLKDIADGIDAASQDLEHRAFLVMTADEETHLARFVYFDWDKCRLGLYGWCDSGKSFSVWQLKEMQRTETTREAAAEALARYQKGVNACGDAQGGIAMYATGVSCSWKKSAAREARMRVLQQKLAAKRHK